jgi:transposase-like protein
MERPDMASLTCVNPECQMFDQPGRGNLKVRKVYGQDQLRLLRCKECGEEFSERRGSALFNTKIPEAKAMSVIEHLDEGCTLTGTARLVKVAKDTVSRLLKVTGRHAKKFHDQEVQGITPQALEFDEQWSYVGKKGEALQP